MTLCSPFVSAAIETNPLSHNKFELVLADHAGDICSVNELLVTDYGGQDLTKARPARQVKQASLTHVSQRDLHISLEIS